jgi:O-antigen/teichoic acid export membrane protein
MIQRFKNNRFVWNSAVLFSGTMLANVLNYLFHFGVGRMVTAEVYGEIESLISLLTILSVPAAAIGIIATKYSAKMKVDENKVGGYEVFRYLNKQVFFFGLPFALFLFAWTPFARDFLKMDSSTPLFFLWVLTLLSFFSAVSGGALSGWQKFGSLNAVGIWSALAKLVLGIAFIRAGFSVHGAVGSFLIAGVVGYGVSLMCLRRIFDARSSRKDNAVISRTHTDVIKKSVLPTFIGILAITMLGNVDMIFAKHALDPVVSGEYGALSIVAKTIFFLTGVIASVLFAMTAGGERKKNASERTFIQATILTGAIGAGAVVFFALFPKFSLGVFFGDKYLNGSQSLVIFASMVALYSLANLFLQYLISLHQMKAMMWFFIMAICEVFLLSLYGTSLYGIIMMTVAVQGIAAAIGFFFIYRTFKHA